MIARIKSQPIVKAIACILLLILIVMLIDLEVRLIVFVFWEQLFAEWCEFVDEFNIHKNDKTLYQTPFEYHMVSIGEVYLLKTYRIYDETGKITEDELKERYRGMVNEANKRFSGNETKLYIGHEVPNFADTTLIYIKPINWIRSFFIPERKIDEHFWFVAIYKKARSPFYM